MNNQHFNELLTCKICKKFYLNPVILPCRNNICEEHVNQKILKNKTVEPQLDGLISIIRLFIFKISLLGV